MKSSLGYTMNFVITLLVLALAITPISSAQQTSSVVPTLVNFSGT